MPNKTPNDASLQSTKQMLDELDALMEKMLTLPVGDPEEAAAFPPPIVTEPTLSATLTLLKPSDSAPASASRKPVHQKPKEDAESEATGTPWPFNPPHYLPTGNSAPSPEPQPVTNEVVPESVLPKLEPLMKDIAEPSGRSLGTQWVYLPLVWVNLGFDGVTLAFGGAGNWIRSEAGRLLLGLSGIALLAAAVIWFLKDWLGWNWSAWFIS